MAALLFDYIRATSLVTDAWCASLVAATQFAADEHFTRIHGIQLDCRFIPPNTQTRPGSIQMWWQDHSPDAGALGFHTDDGMPKGYVFVADCLQDGVDPSVTTTHETWESACDANLTRTADFNGEQYAYEIADSPEDDRFAFRVEGLNGQSHLISAFVTPSWFDANGQPPFVYPETVPITKPFQLAYGGYIGVRQLPFGQWTQRFADEAGPRQIKRPSSRTLRRFNAVA